MVGKEILVLSFILSSLLFSASAQSARGFDGIDRSGRARFTGDKDTRQERTFTTSDYFASEVKAGEVRAPGVPVDEIKGNTLPPGNNTLQRMIPYSTTGRNDSLMGNHE